MTTAPHDIVPVPVDIEDDVTPPPRIVTELDLITASLHDQVEDLRDALAERARPRGLRRWWAAVRRRLGR